jgi:hypothetical protein
MGSPRQVSVVPPEATAFRAALDVVLEPIVRLMLKGGVTWREFTDLAKAKYVDVATSEFGVRGRPTNASRVAILTGLDRRDVRRLRRAAEPAPTQGYVSKASQVLEAWHRDTTFLDVQKQPLPLPLDGAGPTLTDLVRRIAPALPVGAMVKELRSAGALEELPDGRLRPLKRSYVPQPLTAERLRLWSSVLSDISNTIEYNFELERGATPRFERRAVNLHVDRDALPEFRKLLEQEGQRLLERIDDWLSEHQATSVDEKDAVRLGVGVYQIEDRKSRRARGLGQKKGIQK